VPVQVRGVGHDAGDDRDRQRRGQPAGADQPPAAVASGPPPEREDGQSERNGDEQALGSRQVGQAEMFTAR
jgi:hypothetical protein